MFQVVGQFVDFLVKATKAFRETPEGAREWAEVVDAWENSKIKF